LPGLFGFANGHIERVSRKMNKDQVNEPGAYFFKIPHWKSPIMVSVLKLRDELYVSFRNGYLPKKLSLMPENSIFEKV
jgi:hypothetical protein